MSRFGSVRRVGLVVILALGGFVLARAARVLRHVEDGPLEAPPALPSVASPPVTATLHAEPAREPAAATEGLEDAGEASLAFLGGLVSERSGRPLAGSRCELRAGVPGGGFLTLDPRAPSSALATAVTDGEGRFRLPVAPGHWRLRVEHPGFAPWEADHLVAGDEVLARLDPLVRLSVTVLAPDAAPVEGATVTLRPAGARAPEERRDELRTDARGQAESLALAPGSWRLAVRHPGYATVAVPLEVPVGCFRIEREIRLERGARLVGTVRAEDGAPLAEARIRIESPYRETFLLVEVQSDEHGRYATDPLFSTLETLEVLVSATGHTEATEWLGIQPADVAAGEAVRDFVLGRAGLTLRGRAVDAAGAGVDGASVRIAAIDLAGTDPTNPAAVFQVAPRAPWLWQEVARTDAAGAFELRDLACTREQALLLVHPGFAPRVAWCPALEPGSVHDLGDLLLAGAGSLTGRARWEDGTPAAGERLALGKANRIHFRERAEIAAFRPDSWFHVLETRTDADGRFRFDLLAPGTYHFASTSTSGQPAQEVLAGRVTGPIELVLAGRPAGPEQTLAGVVRAPDGAPLPMVLVQAFALEDAGERVAGRQLTDARGAFSLRVPERSAVRLSLADLRGVHEPHELHLPPASLAEELELVLEPRSLPLPPIDGLVYDPHGATLEGSTVTLRPPEDSLCACITFQKLTDAAGAFRFSVAEGPHRLSAAHPLHAPATHAPAWPGDHVELALGER